MSDRESQDSEIINEMIGFMQGRLSPLRNGRIQSFPWETWQDEFEAAANLNIRKLEWTIDSENFASNPILTLVGREKIRRLKTLFNIETPSVTCDYFMENPPWKSDSEHLFMCVESILMGMTEIGAKILVIPLVDNSSLIDSNSYSRAFHFFSRVSDLLGASDLKIAFETDLGPECFSDFMSEFAEERYGVNYDIGNSASLGFNPTEEFAAFGPRIINVHVKDRALGGTTVPLGTGNADFQTVFRCLNDHGYMGNLIMQTARAHDGKHAEVLATYREQIVRWMEEAK
jgi:L-ribulose-5-phosphate 3-epimerase